MLARLKRGVKKVLRIKGGGTQQEEEKPLHFDDERIIIRRDSLEESLPIIHEMVEVDDGLIPRRKVTLLKWNGPIIEVEGYFYLENFPLEDEDLVKKRLILFDELSGKVEIPLEDIKTDELQTDDTIDDAYAWAGFRGKTNLSTIEKGNKPLQNSVYEAYLEIEVKVLGDKKYKKLIPFGNIQHFLEQGFHATKMEFFSARRVMKYNLLATYDQNLKTLRLKSTKLRDLDPLLLDLDSSGRKSLVYRLENSFVFRGLYKFFCLFPLQEKKILFASDSRADVSGNFQFVYEEMLRRDLDFDYHFMLKGKIRATKTLGEMIALAYHLATSRFIFLDDFYPMVYPLKIRKNADLVQLWHAVGAFKTFGFSRIGLPGGPSPKSKNHRNYTKAIVSSKNIAKYYAEGFGIDEERVIPTGIPRTDVFFDESYQEKVREELYNTYPYLRDKKVILFAPTFRGNGQQSAHYPMETLELKKLYESLRDEYVFLYKIHPFVKNDFSIPYEYSDFFYDFSDYREINNLLFITDILITDYSSVCFEFALLNRPMLFFAYDAEKYVEQRDFYFDYHSFIPGPLVKSTDRIIETIREQDFKMEKIEPFVKYFFDKADGNSSARVVDEIILHPEEEDQAD